MLAASVLTQNPDDVQFVMRHAPGARALKFVRRLPLFKGLGDNNLVSVASRMREKVYQVSSSIHCVLYHWSAAYPTAQPSAAAVLEGCVACNGIA